MLLTIESEALSAQISTNGAAVVSAHAWGQQVIGMDPLLPESSSSGSVLAPWPNRLEDGSWEWQGQTYVAAITEQSTQTALHGFLNHAEWEVELADPAQVILRAALEPSAGYPARLELTTTYAVEGARLDVEVAALNASGSAVPIGIGMHPYFTVPSMATASLQLDATHALALDRRALPTALVERSASWASLEDVRLDDCFEGSRAVLRHSGLEIEVVGGDTCQWLMAFTSDTLQEPWRRSAVALEPMTCPPNALPGPDRPCRADVVAPGESLALSWSVAVRRT